MDLRVRMQGIVLLGVSLRVIPATAGLPLEELLERLVPTLRRYVGERGEDVVAQNRRCIARGYAEVAEVPRPVMMRDLEGESLALRGKVVRDLMTAGVVSCRPDTPLPQVVNTMKEHDVSAVVVTDERGALQGVISVTDLHRAHTSRQLLDGYLPEVLPSHLMTRPVLTTWPEERLEAAVHRLFEHHVHRLVVTAGETDPLAVGILSASDLLTLLPEESH